VKNLTRRSSSDVDWQHIHARLTQAAVATREALQPSPVRVAALLDERARRLARPLVASHRSGVMLELLEFRLVGERYGIETCFVREVVRCVGLTPVPGAPAIVAGLVNLRGQILVAFDLRPLFGLTSQDVTNASRIVVCSSAQDQLGIVVDSAHAVTTLPAEELRSNAMSEEQNHSTFVRGITAGAMIVLDGSLLLTDRRLSVDHSLPQ